MTKSSAYRLRLKTLASIAIGLTSFVVAACSSTNGMVPGGNVVPSRAVRPLSQPTATPTPYNYSYATVDDEGGSTTFSRILGMDDLAAVVGYFSAASITRGFSSNSPYTQFRVVNYPNSQSTVATSMSTGNLYFAGYFLNSSNGKTWAWIRYKGIWGWYEDPKVPKGPNTVTEFLGINDSEIAVGFYNDAYNNPQPLVFSNRKFAGLHPPNEVSAKATGINKRGEIVGSEILANGTTIGWLYRSGSYSTFSYPNSNDTEPTAVNFQDQVVGSYADSSGNIHGFVVTGPSNPQTARWQTIDEPKADGGTTVVTSINNHHSIVGWYVDPAGNNNGFVAQIPGS